MAVHAHLGHDHTHAHPTTAPRMIALALLLTLAFVAAEAIAAWVAHSLALFSDAAHNLADAAALGLSWYGLSIARKPSNHGMTYGYHRVGIGVAWINGLSLVALAIWIMWEAAKRLQAPPMPQGPLMIGVALAAVVVNGVIGWRLHAHSKHDLNIRSAYLHMIGDAVSALGVAIAGVAIAVTGRAAADPIASILIAVLILWSSYRVIRDSTTVLLEGTPPGTDMPAVLAAIKAVPGVLNVHDLHVWMVGPGVVACSCHIVVADRSAREGQAVLREVVRDIERRFHITHTTVQVEVEGCAPGEICGPTDS